MENLSISHHLLEEIGYLDHIYNAIRSMDMPAAVLVALQGMRIVGSLPDIPKTGKNALLSRTLRTEGNAHYASVRYLKALECYNKALLFAPRGSIELLHAYSNRSALLLKLTAYSASYRDIETCLKLECTGDLLNKLNKRKIECTNLMWKENLKNYTLLHGFPEYFFKFNEKKHPEIPCLSADVDIVSVSGKKKVAAAKDIAVGSVVALETAFTTHSIENKSLVACYYCQKMTLNLTPCDNCCYALFCSAECQKLCVSEYHDIECQIMDVLETLKVAYIRLTIKTVLKLLKKCKTWSKLIEESNNIGASRLRSSSARQIYNVEDYSSILCFKEDRHFVHGFMYNNCFMYAAVLHYLEKIPGFFPASDFEAKKCFSELCMRLGMTCCYITEINNTAENVSEQQVRCDDAPSHFGWFTLTGKLRHSCDPNVVMMGLNNRMALVAIKPIKKTTEITVSKIGHYYDRIYGDRHKRASMVYQYTLNACSCRICHDSWGLNLFQKELTPSQKKIMSNWKKSTDKSGYRLRDPLYFKDTCNALTELVELANTKEHAEIFGEFRKQLGLFQYAATLNAMI